MSYVDWKVGDKVVCVDDTLGNYSSWKVADECMDGLVAGRVYTIRRVGVFAGTLCVWLREIHRPLRGRLCRQFGEIGFAAARFRPVQTRKTDISVFTRILNNPKLPIKEDA